MRELYPACGGPPARQAWAHDLDHVAPVTVPTVAPGGARDHGRIWGVPQLVEPGRRPVLFMHRESVDDFHQTPAGVSTVHLESG